MTLDEIIKSRRSVRLFDTEHVFDHSMVTKALELAILAPNSSNLQCWEFYRINDKEKINEMYPLCLKQNAVRTASELVLFVTRRDKWRERCDWHLSQVLEMHNDAKRIEKSIRYYKKSIPFFYRDDPFGFYSLMRFFYLQFNRIKGRSFSIG